MSEQSTDDPRWWKQFYRWVFGHGYERNVGGIDRTFRYVSGTTSIIAGVGLLFFRVFDGFAVTVLLSGILIIGGLYAIYEAQVQYCPVNNATGRMTYRK